MHHQTQIHVNVYVVDSQNERIQKFDSNGNFITKWGSEGTGEGQFNIPEGIDIDSSGNVYVADTHNSRIQKFAIVK
jgi:DNA-binding beta-propeller fold protein YncE